jgi:hypothetical protein
VAESQTFEKTPKKAGRWFRAFIVLSLLYGITFSLDGFFNWIFFCAALYSLFMSYFLLPVQPKVFQSRPRESRGGQFNTGQFQQSQAAPTVQASRARRVIIGIAAIVFGLFLLPPMIQGFIAGWNGEDLPDTSNGDEASLQTEPANDAMAYVDIGNEFFNNQQYDSAEAYYEKALEVDANYGAAVYGRGIVSYNRGRIDEANSFFLSAYEKGYRYPWLSWALADMYDKQGQTVRATEFYKESVGLDSSYTDSYKRLAEIEPANRQKWLDLAERYKED